MAYLWVSTRKKQTYKQTKPNQQQQQAACYVPGVHFSKSPEIKHFRFLKTFFNAQSSSAEMR